MGGRIYVVRLANVYGGYKYLDKKQTCVKQFVMAYGRNDPLVIHGDGEQRRDFINVLDVCEAIKLILEKRPKQKDPMDIGTGIGTSINELADMFGTKNVIRVNVRSVGTDSSIANVDAAIKRIGFMAVRNLKDYIKGEIGNGN
jgi:nucleoside-diphosphate-sugar epimerase